MPCALRWRLPWFCASGHCESLTGTDIYPSEIAGTSAGSIAGAFLACGFTADEIKEMFVDKIKPNMVAWNHFKLGLISMNKIRDFIQKNLRYKNFEDLPIPFYATATNFIDGRQHIFHTGSIIDAIIAASSIPILFPPVFIDNIPFVDGGLSNNLPVEPFINKINEVISIYVNPISLFNPKDSTAQLIDRTLHLVHREMVGRALAGCFLYIEPVELQKFGLFDIHKLPDIFEIGYRYTKELLEINQGLIL